MKKELSITHLSQVAWEKLQKEWSSWMILSINGAVLMVLSIVAHLYLPEYRHIVTLLLCFPGALYSSILHKNALDAVYGRSLSMIHCTQSILVASLFFIVMYAYQPLYNFLKFSLVALLPEAPKLIMLVSIVAHIILAYVCVRFMFVGIIILEEELPVLDAFRKSFALTEHHVLLLFGMLFYFSIALALSAFTVIGYFAVLPYTILLKALLFKKLNSMNKA